jgi:RNA polymerase sigma-70 factor (ECF subfamily)
MIRKARAGKPTAVDEFVLRYRPPVISFILKNGFSKEDAEDLSQEVFLKIFKDKVLQKADEQKGRFRSLILAVTKNVIKEQIRKKMAQKRGGGTPEISLDQLIEEDKGLKELVTTDEKDELFDKEWLKNLMQIALQKLKENTIYFDVIDLFLKDLSIKQIAEKIGKKEKETQNYFYQAKLKLIKYVHEQIKDYCSSEQEYEQEVEYLSSFF